MTDPQQRRDWVITACILATVFVAALVAAHLWALVPGPKH